MVSHSHPRKRVYHHRVSAVTSDVSPALLPNTSGSSIPMSGPSRELVIRGHSVHHRGETSEWGRRGQVTIDILPGDVLLEIFNVYTHENSLGWPTLVHVCQRWRSIVFASPHHLNLQLRCTYKTPARKMLDIWPALPIIIEDSHGRVSRVKGASNLIAAFKHRNRVRHIDLQDIPKSVLKRFTGAMKDPFPALTYLELDTDCETAPVLPDSFLGGFAPRLLTLRLSGIPFPAMPNLLSSACDLVTLYLWGIPHSGYISPEAMATGLSALTGLVSLSIGFRSPRARPDQPSPPRLTRTSTVLPALNRFEFKGVSEYLEDLTSLIDAPLLSDFRISFFNQLIFNTPRLCSFISRAEKLRSYNRAQVAFSNIAVSFSITASGHSRLYLSIICSASDWQLSSLTQVCASPFLSLFNLERLEICKAFYSRPRWQEDVEHIQWLELLHPFTTMKSLFLSMEFAPRVVPALKVLSSERIMDVLPALQSIFLSESSLSRPVKKALTHFLTARRRSGHPVAVNPQGQE